APRRGAARLRPNRRHADRARGVRGGSGMSTQVTVSTPVQAAREQAGAASTRAGRARSRRRTNVMALRVAIFVVLIGGWELSARAGVVDPFFFGEPSRIVSQLKTWIEHGTDAGS